jgi:hypothetical protein
MLREALGRRGLFKRLGVGALLAASGQDAIAKMAQVGVSGNVGSGVVGLNTLGAIQKARSAHRVFTTAADFSTWWREYGKLNRLSGRVHEIDPDIAGFRLPFGTKLRMQQERNYFRAKAEAKAGFLYRLMRDGNVTIFRDYDNPDCATGTASGGYASKGFG